MSQPRCPGQDRRFWKLDDIFELKCPTCGEALECWKDEPFRKCPDCDATVPNPRIDLGCAQWCEHAEECLENLGAGWKESSVRERLISEMKSLFGDDERRIAHAMKVLEYAEEMLKLEEGSHLVVRAAAILHDIGIHEAERKHDSPAGRYQEIEGPPIARRIMEQTGLDEETVEHVCRIIANHHSARNIDTPEFRIVWDADWLVNIPDEFPNAGKRKLKAVIDKAFKTDAGKEKAYELFVN